MASYDPDRRAWSDTMLNAVRHIVGPYLLQSTPFEMDCKQAADLFVFTARDVTIAVRVRRPGYADRYPYEFTVRSGRDSGATTELAKIVDGWGDWFFYGHANDNDAIARWWLVDLKAFRAGIIRHKMNKCFLVMKQKSNGDGTHFVAFDLRSFPSKPEILIASSHPLSVMDRRFA